MTTLRLTAVAALALGTLVLPVVPAYAQDQETGSRFARDQYDGDRDARETLNYFGRCVAAYKSDKIEAFLLNPTQETWEPVIYSPNRETRCAMRNMAAGFREYSGTVAEGWYVRKFMDAPPVAFTEGEQLAPPQAEVEERILSVEEDERGVVIVDEFARCVAATAPLEIDALLRTTVQSREERAAVRAISPHLGPCAFEGQDLSFDYESLRSMLAYALATRAVQSLDGSN